QRPDAGVRVYALEPQVLRTQSLIGNVRLLKKRHPWRDRGAEDGDENQQERRAGVKRRDHRMVDHVTPFWVSQECRHDVADEDQREGEQDPFNDAKRSPENQKPDEECADRDRDVASKLAEEKL